MLGVVNSVDGTGLGHPQPLRRLGLQEEGWTHSAQSLPFLTVLAGRWSPFVSFVPLTVVPWAPEAVPFKAVPVLGLDTPWTGSFAAPRSHSLQTSVCSYFSDPIHWWPGSDCPHLKVDVCNMLFEELMKIGLLAQEKLSKCPKRV